MKYLGLLLSLNALAVSPEDLQKYSQRLGFNRPLNTFVAINDAAKEYDVNPYKLLKIAAIESGVDHNKINFNKNNTVDKGLFQINSVHFASTCKTMDIDSLIGNARCAAKIIRELKKHAELDPLWVGRYHSKTPSLKEAYHQRYVEISEKALHY